MFMVSFSLHFFIGFMFILKRITAASEYDKCVEKALQTTLIMKIMLYSL